MQLPFSTHPAFGELVDELHSRPHPEIYSPCSITHLALLHEPGEVPHLEAIRDLCKRYSAPPPHQERHHAAVLGTFRMRWEQHTEFSSFTFVQTLESASGPFSKTAIEPVPTDWLAALPGELIAGTELVFESTAERRSREDFERLFEGQRLCASSVADGTAEVWTAFRVDGCNLCRMLVRDRGLNSETSGRLAQTLIELDTYRMMALMGLPLAKQCARRLNVAEQRLAQLVEHLGSTADFDGESELLDELFALAGEAERSVAQSAFRFSATRAYADLVNDRRRDLRERPLDGYQPIGEFLEKRFTPAMRTCLSMDERQHSLSRRIGRTADLARTRVDVELQKQNRTLLTSMNRRAELQVRLQETVEGLSVVAISYYLVGLLSYLFKPVMETSLHTTALAWAVPLVIGAAWLSLRRFRKKLHDEH